MLSETSVDQKMEEIASLISAVPIFKRMLVSPLLSVEMNILVQMMRKKMGQL